MPNSLEIQQPLSADRQVVKINDDSTGLLLKDNRVFVEEQPTEENEVATKKYVDSQSASTPMFSFQTTARIRTQYNNWYYGANVSYGYNYYYWVSSTGSTATPTAYVDSSTPFWLAPVNGKVVSYSIIGNISTTDTMEWMVMKGTQPTFGSAGNWSMSQVGSTQSAGGTANILYKFEETDLTVDINKNDMLAMYFRRTTDNDSSYSYGEFSISINMEY